jgi:rhodanese-related sulfurtransferase
MSTQPSSLPKTLHTSKIGLSLTNITILCLVTVLSTAIVFYSVPAIRYSDIVEPTITDIDPIVFYQDFKIHPERYVFLDVRSADAYNSLHALGSNLQPLHTLYTERLRLPKNDSNKKIVLICSGGIASGVAFSYLQHYGYRNIARINGGIESWQTEKLPVEGSHIIKQ